MRPSGLCIKSLMDALAMAGKAGVLLSGFSKVEAALSGARRWP